MIKLKAPSFAFNSVDVPSPHYRMWENTFGHRGFSTAQLVQRILVVNTLARDILRERLLNIVINAHGWEGGGGISIGGQRSESIYLDTVHEFHRLKPKNLGTIWLVACEAAAGSEGKRLCQTLATVSGCLVVAADADQDTGIWGSWRLVTSLNNIDEFEGTVYAFMPKGGMKIIDPHADVFTTADWE